MIRKLHTVFFCLYLSMPIMAASVQQVTDEPSPTQVVSAFQKMPHYELFCKDETWDSAEPIKIGSKFEQYYTKEFYRLFLWSQCIEPLTTPPHYEDLNYNFFWDIRFGIHKAGVDNREGKFVAKKIRVQPAKLQGPGKATIKVLFDFGTLKNIVTTYTLIRENGQWKIDDIAPQGDYVDQEGDQDPSLDHSNSIKTDMQRNYRAAEERNKQEQAKKSAAHKP